MGKELFPLVYLDGSTALALGLGAFVLHLAAYSWYAFEIFRGRTRPNTASWMMWLVGAWVEYVTYNGIDNHWSSSALPLACLIGVCSIFLATALLQGYRFFKNIEGVAYEKPETNDYFLVLADISAYALYVTTGGAVWANFIAVSTSIVTFIPLWKTTYRNGNEHPGPWILWCTAYGCMLGAVISEGGSQVIEKGFYPVYYFLLHFVVVVLACKSRKT